ncbi:Sdh5 family protein [Devosia sp. H5989]|nr:Sdh5 family protein [Devosia sp. H5989]
MALQNSAGEDTAMRRRRMRYRAWHRGTREMDLILGPYADAHIEGLPEAQLDRLEKLMNEEDTDLLKWIMGQEPVPGDVDAELLAVLARFNDARLAGI